MDGIAHEPLYRGIMLSSTFRDLVRHRTRAREVIDRAGYKPVAMENDGALTIDVLESSLTMVNSASIYVCVIGLRYGQVLEHDALNPARRSLTELEFELAERRGMPILLYVMDNAHPTTRADHVDDAERTARDAFAERAARIKGQEPKRVYYTFTSEDDFAQRLGEDLGRLSRTLAPRADAPGDEPNGAAAPPHADRHPTPPARAACPGYGGSHDFVGRRGELDALDEWADPAGQHPLYVLSAIGGSGKSFLTWRWMETRAVPAADAAGAPWAGRFWYSFYEAGATMTDMCRQALAYFEQRPRDAFDRETAPQVEARLLSHLAAARWLLILDGLERVLVEYNRPGASRSESPEILPAETGRGACHTIRPADGAFLLQLAQAAPSRVLATTRLVPADLLNPSGQPRAGVRSDPLQGLRGEDAEVMMRAAGVRGDGRKLRDYLRRNCDNHPLTMGVLAGLIAHYPRAPGDFDAWVEDPDHGRALRLGDLDLKQRQNHILRAGLDALDADARALMGSLSFLHAGADYATLEAINPKRPLPPERVAGPGPVPEGRPDFLRTGRDAFRAYEAELAEWKRDPAVREARRWLDAAIHSLRDRGLLLHEGGTARYDLHPVVRSVVADGLTGQAQEAAGQRVIDHFTAAPHVPYEEAETLADLTVGLELMRALTRLGRFQAAIDVYMGKLARALYFNLDARDEMRALLRPFFPDGWGGEPAALPARATGYLLNDAALALDDAGTVESLRVRSLQIKLAEEDANNIAIAVLGLALCARNAGRLAESERLLATAFRLCEDEDDRKYNQVFELVLAVEMHRPDVMSLGETVAAFEQRPDSFRFRKSAALVWYAEALRRAGRLTDTEIAEAEHWAVKLKDRAMREAVHVLRARRRLDSEGAAAALPHFDEALAMIRERGELDHSLEAEYLRVRCLAGHIVTPEDAARLDDAQDEATLSLAELWETLGDAETAAAWALRAHIRAVADGEPYVRRWELDRTRALLTRLGRPLPEVPNYDPARYSPHEWEAEVEVFADRLEARRADEESLRQAVRDRDLDRIRALSREGVSIYASGEDGQDAYDLVNALERANDPLAQAMRDALLSLPEDTPD